MTSINGC